MAAAVARSSIRLDDSGAPSSRTAGSTVFRVAIMSMLSTARIRARSSVNSSATYCRLPCRPCSSPPKRMRRRSWVHACAASTRASSRSPAEPLPLSSAPGAGAAGPPATLTESRCAVTTTSPRLPAALPARSATTFSLRPPPTWIDGRVVVYPSSVSRAAAMSAARMNSPLSECRVPSATSSAMSASRAGADSWVVSARIAGSCRAGAGSGRSTTTTSAGSGAIRQQVVCLSGRPRHEPLSTISCRPWSSRTRTCGCSSWKDRPTWRTSASPVA